VRQGRRVANAHWSTCRVCGKTLYASRKDAKAATRQTPSRKHGGTSMREYRAEETCGPIEGWHIGHLAPLVRRGRQSAADYYATRSA
jgi:hypothetical protein